jgi:very-short-patch-repair endonuclease
MTSRGHGRARTLRRDMTDAEKRLWLGLRARQIDGWQFRRQAPIGPYFADIVCFARHLIVEVDGGQHSAEADATRTAWLEAEGFRILRFWNHDVLRNPEGVLDEIRRVVNSLREPPPQPSPQGGGS